MRPLNLVSIQLRNLLLFTTLALRHRTPLRLWPRAWREVDEAHRQWVHKAVWELKKEGRVRQDREGRLWSTRKR